MRRVLPLFLLLGVGFALQSDTASAAPGQPVVDIVKVDGVIDSSMADYLTGTLDAAERDGSTVVLQLDTPGTLNVDGVRLAERVFSSRVPVVVWVGPSGARATGAGFMLVYASSLAVISPGSGMGPLSPLDLSRKPSLEDPNELSGVTTLLDQWAIERDRRPPDDLPQEPLTAQNALLQNVADCAKDVPFTGDNPEDCAVLDVADLLQKIDGRTVPTAAGAVTLATRTTPDRPVLVRFHDLGISKRVLHAVASPVAIYVLLVLGLAGLAFELTQSGIGFAGFAGLGALALAGYGLAVVPFDPLGLGLFLAGSALLILDVRLRRLGILSALGLAAFGFGSFWMFHEVAPAIDVSPWLIGGAIVAAILYYGFGLTVAIKARERIVTAQVGLVGLLGETRGNLDPEGPVFVKGTLWKGKTNNGPIPPGTKVRVRGVDGLILRVEPEEGGPSLS